MVVWKCWSSRWRCCVGKQMLPALMSQSHVYWDLLVSDERTSECLCRKWHHSNLYLLPLTGSCVLYLQTLSCWTLRLIDHTWRTLMDPGGCPPHRTSPFTLQVTWPFLLLQHVWWCKHVTSWWHHSVICFLLRESHEPGRLHQYGPYCWMGDGLQSGPVPAKICYEFFIIIIFSSSFIVVAAASNIQLQLWGGGGDSL